MKAKFYRFIFENTEDAIVHSGFIWDNIYAKTTKYVYTAGVQKAGRVFTCGNDKLWTIKSQQPISFYVLGTGSPLDLCCLLRALDDIVIDTVIMPYQTPMERKISAQKVVGKDELSMKLRECLLNPYEYLRQLGVHKVFLIEGNDGNGKPQDEEGIYFRSVSKIEQRQIAEMEGQHIPVYQAGYIVENQWCFYFGSFGKSLQLRYELQRDQETMQEILGDEYDPSLIMYHGSMKDNVKTDFALQKVREFDANEGCHVDIPFTGKSCVVECMYKNDYDFLKSQNQEGATVLRNGMLLYGNVDLNEYGQKIWARFEQFGDKIRFFTIPNGGNLKQWNPQLLKLYPSGELRYWLCPCSERTSSEILKQIEMETVHQKFIGLTPEKGACFSGYLVPGGRE